MCQVYQHRMNTLRIRALKQESKELDDALLEIMTSLAAMQQSLLLQDRAATTTIQEQSKKVKVSTLLTYAARIAHPTHKSDPWPTVLSTLFILLEK